MTVTISYVGSRFGCGRIVRKTARDKDFGLLVDVKLTRLSIFIWHVQFDVEAKV